MPVLFPLIAMLVVMYWDVILAWLASIFFIRCIIWVIEEIGLLIAWMTANPWTALIIAAAIAGSLDLLWKLSCWLDRIPYTYPEEKKKQPPLLLTHNPYPPFPPSPCPPYPLEE